MDNNSLRNRIIDALLKIEGIHTIREGCYEYADQGVDIGCYPSDELLAVLHGIMLALSSSAVRCERKYGFIPPIIRIE